MNRRELFVGMAAAAAAPIAAPAAAHALRVHTGLGRANIFYLDGTASISAWIAAKMYEHYDIVTAPGVGPPLQLWQAV